VQVSKTDTFAGSSLPTLIVVAGSAFAGDSLEVLRRFAKRKPLGDMGPKTAPEDFLARRMKAVPEKRHFGDRQLERDRYFPDGYDCEREVDDRYDPLDVYPDARLFLYESRPAMRCCVIVEKKRDAASIEALCIRCGQAKKSTRGYHNSRRCASRSRCTSANASGSTNRPCRS